MREYYWLNIQCQHGLIIQCMACTGGLATYFGHFNYMSLPGYVFPSLSYRDTCYILPWYMFPYLSYQDTCSHIHLTRICVHILPGYVFLSYQDTCSYLTRIRVPVNVQPLRDVPSEWHEAGLDVSRRQSLCERKPRLGGSAMVNVHGSRIVVLVRRPDSHIC
jgi:hypothetical protein